MIKETIEKIVSGKDLSENQMYVVFNEIMSGKATNAQIGSFVTALRMKGETVEEITGAVKVMRKKSLKVKVGPQQVDIDRDDINIDKETILDTCGTGGSGTNTFNISTTVAFIIAACGIRVAKHGNRAASSRCGSADVLEELGVNLKVPVEMVEQCINEIGIGFLFAPLFHGAMKYAIEPRREIGIRTIFNILGPLSNPAGATKQVLGVYKKELVPMLAKVLRNLGCRRAFVVHGMDTLDEVTITGKTYVAELKNKKIRTFFVEPKDFGLKRSSLDNIKGGSAKQNSKIVLDVLGGKKGPKRDVTLMNASAALVVSGKAKDFRSGVKMAALAIDSGSALEALNQLKELTNKK